jgi:hypothetical protein
MRYLVELYDVGVPEYLENADLSGDSFDICLFNNFLFLKCLNGHFLTSRDMDAQPHLAESALANGLACIKRSEPIRYCPRTNSLFAVLMHDYKLSNQSI